jgi:hypothetical protein
MRVPTHHFSSFLAIDKGASRGSAARVNHPRGVKSSMTFGPLVILVRSNGRYRSVFTKY